MDHNKLWEILKEMGLPDHLTSLLRNLYAGQKQQVELDMEQQTGSKQEKEYIKGVYCHPAYLTSVQSISVKCWAGWLAARSSMPGEILITSDTQMTQPQL